ncbi:MAG: serine/threonine protein kinase [Deltaproteobacteria bacterium]|nr:MAG: serine/threonine protein kinase [Deltaproteobacteria bacterium]
MSGFVIVRKLAEGGMGAVYLAEHERLTHIRKVVKVLLPAYARHGELQQRFEREAHAASRLHHDHILKIDNFGKLPGGQPWLMTEILHGQPLDEFLRTRGRLAEHRALLVLLQLCSALEHAHKLGIIHRDLKPSNVFVCPTKQQPFAIKLLDFGIAKMLNEATDGAGTRSGAIMGTPSYMAVEQYDHAHAVTPHADIFSPGVMTCEMVTGRLPWGNHDQAVRARTRWRSPPRRRRFRRTSPVAPRCCALSRPISWTTRRRTTRRCATSPTAPCSRRWRGRR